MTQSPEQLAAELYDLSVPDWDGELNFYRELTREAKARGESVLEVACGTGRVSIRLAEEGVSVVSTDLDAAMLEVARGKRAKPRIVSAKKRSTSNLRTTHPSWPGHDLVML